MESAAGEKGPAGVEPVARGGINTGCGSCRHALVVRGCNEVVCMPFLEMREPECGGNCEQYERRKQQALQAIPDAVPPS